MVLPPFSAFSFIHQVLTCDVLPFPYIPSSREPHVSATVPRLSRPACPFQNPFLFFWRVGKQTLPVSPLSSTAGRRSPASSRRSRSPFSSSGCPNVASNRQLLLTVSFSLSFSGEKARQQARLTALDLAPLSSLSSFSFFSSDCHSCPAVSSDRLPAS